MKIWLLTSVCVLAGGAIAGAQTPSLVPSARPTFSPWLNLNRPGTNPVLNYYGLVRPQMTYNSSILQLQQETHGLQQQQQDLSRAAAEPLPTGHATGFMTHTKYFLTKGAINSGNAPAPAVATTATHAPKKTH